MWWKRHKGKAVAAVVLAAVLVLAFWYGGSAPGMQGWEQSDAPQPPSVPASGLETIPDQSEPPPMQIQTPSEETAGFPQQPTQDTPALQDPAPPAPAPEPDSTLAPPAQTQPDPEPASPVESAPVPETPPVPSETLPGTSEELTCTLSVRCDAVFDHLDWLTEGKEDILPENGYFYPETQVSFSQGESVFDLLQREMKKAGIPMEFSETPAYQSAYIEGIGNLYEFDCGELSGWLYQVNGEQFSYGCSRHQLQPGDSIEWVYTCQRGF